MQGYQGGGSLAQMFGLPLADLSGFSGDLQKSLESALAAKNALPKEADVDKIRKQMEELDVNKDRTLSFEEMKDMLRSVSPNLSEIQLQKLFCAADVNQNGSVDLREFRDFVLHGKEAAAKVVQEPPQGTPSTDGIRSDWKKDVLEAHNELRAEHGAGKLEWNDECYLQAKKQANLCQQRGCMMHGSVEGPSGRHGQNIYWCSAPGSSAKEMVKSWYEELLNPGYDFGQGNYSPGAGHFTQVVWKGSTGVGMAVSEDGRFCVANYFPAGNMMGAFKENVLPRGSPYVPKKEEPKPRPAPSAGGGGGGGAGAGTTVTAKDMTPEMAAAFDGCPFPFKARVEAAMQAGAEVTVDRSVQGTQNNIVVTIKQGMCTSKMSGAWGGGCF